MLLFACIDYESRELTYSYCATLITSLTCCVMPAYLPSITQLVLRGAEA